jgi:hypothetical protein
MARTVDERQCHAAMLTIFHTARIRRHVRTDQRSVRYPTDTIYRQGYLWQVALGLSSGRLTMIKLPRFGGAFLMGRRVRYERGERARKSPGASRGSRPRWGARGVCAGPLPHTWARTAAPASRW